MQSFVNPTLPIFLATSAACDRGGRWLGSRFMSLSWPFVVSGALHVGFLLVGIGAIVSDGGEAAHQPPLTVQLVPQAPKVAALTPPTTKVLNTNTSPNTQPAVQAQSSSPTPMASQRPAVTPTPSSAVVKDERPAKSAYLAGLKLEEPPRPLTDIEPVFPDNVGKQNGTVVLTLFINEMGTVDDVAVVRAFPLAVFEDYAVKAFKEARFSPGKMLGAPVKSQMTIEVNFSWVQKDA